MYIDQKQLEAWMERIMERFDQSDKKLDNLKHYNLLEGERLLDNYDMCQLFKVSKRTLQRYRSSGKLPYFLIHHKTYYKERDVHAFIRTHFENQKPKNRTDSVEKGRKDL